MKTIGLFSQKGGSGKTTLALTLAACAARKGKRTRLFDCDPQQSALRWSKTRTVEPFEVVKASPFSLANDLAKAKKEKIECVFVDFPPHLEATSIDLARQCDVIGLPVQPTPLDLAAARGTVPILEASGARWGFILNRCPNGAPEIAMALEALRVNRLVFGVVGDRRIFFRSMIDGRTAIDAEPNGKAAAEIEALYQDMMK